MTDFEDRPVDVRSVARQEDDGDQLAPSMLRGATSALLREVFRRTSAEIPHDSGSGPAAIPEGSRNGLGLVSEDSGAGSGSIPSHVRGCQTAHG